MRTTEHDQRLQSREAQSRAWAAPLPDPQPNISAFSRVGPRMRAEWETRDTINNRLWADTMSAGAKAVTSAMLESHPTHGAQVMQPSAARIDNRSYRMDGVAYFPDAPNQLDRPTLPPKSLFQNPWSAGYDIESGDIARELRGVVKENNRFLTEDVSARMAGRTFEHQWIPPEKTREIAERKIDASELLRPAHDDYRQTYLQSLQNEGKIEYQDVTFHDTPSQPFKKALL
jgi:hypothetical protein